MVHLQRRKLYDQQIQTLQNQCFTLEKQLVTLEDFDDASSTMDCLQMASQASKQSLQELEANNFYEVEEQLKADLDEARESKAKLDSMFANNADLLDQDAELAAELEKMTLGQEDEERKEQAEKEDAQKLEAQLAEWEFKMQELRGWNNKG